MAAVDAGGAAAGVPPHADKNGCGGACHEQREQRLYGGRKGSCARASSHSAERTLRADGTGGGRPATARAYGQRMTRPGVRAVLTAEPGRWRRRAGVRLTTALVAALVVGTALGASGVLLEVLLQRTLSEGVRAATQQRAQDVAGALTAGGLSRVSLYSRGGESSVAQVLQGDQVALSSPDVAGQPPLTAMRPSPGVLLERDTGRLPIDGDQDHTVVAAGVHSGDGRDYVVVVAQSLGEVGTVLTALTTLLAAGIPVLVVLVGCSTFLLVGRALRPVESIRQRVADLDAGDLGRRVPVPPAQDEIRRLALTMNGMLDRLESAAAGSAGSPPTASHELRSPLANVGATVEVARRADAAAGRRSATWCWRRPAVCRRWSTTCCCSPATTSTACSCAVPTVDLDDLLRLEAERLRASRRLDVAVEVSPVRVDGDRQRLARALRNVVDNAAAHAHREVHLGLRVEGAQAVIEVTDDGPGVPAADRERVFERFVRLATGGPGPRAAPGSAWRSSGRSSPRTAGRRASSTPAARDDVAVPAATAGRLVRGEPAVQSSGDAPRHLPGVSWA